MQKLAIYLISLPLSLLACNASVAQNSSARTVNVTVSARIISSVELVTVRSMRLSGEEVSNDIININPLTSSNAGKMVAIGSPNSNIRLSYLGVQELMRQPGFETLMFEYSIAANTEDDQSSAELLDYENRNLNFNSEGQLYLWIGGRVDISSASPGSYRGEFTVEIEYI